MDEVKNPRCKHRGFCMCYGKPFILSFWRNDILHDTKIDDFAEKLQNKINDFAGKQQNKIDDFAKIQ
ncbi:hypothetical protein KQI22_02430 [Kineothrix sp. MSJ-39]|uniref:hypothetical protein n=1 Tax=Kineothrix sp. MSJ-39 TaxID=2841533 RepID=UPI001C1282D2|nr:hypothetical protein [Kineothrix sp. MSJ-39]MBU5428926.1 hypothetical protein [Kineothrix sp. MSJ-39]